MNKKTIIFSFLLTSAITLSAQNSISYSAFKDKVLEYSQVIKQSIAQQKALQASMKLSKTAFLPAFDVSGSYQYRINDYSMDFGGASIAMKNSSYSAELGVVQPIYAGGAIINNYKAVSIQKEIADKALELTKENIIYSAEVCYWGTLAQREMYKKMCEYVDIINNLTNNIKDKYELGQIRKTDYIQMQARLKDAQLQCSNSLQQYKLAMQNMNIMMGVDPYKTIDITDSISSKESISSTLNVDNAINNRSDFSISQLEVDYQKRQVSIAESKYNPTLSVGLNSTWGTQLLNIDGSTVTNSTLFVSLKLPIFHWGARYKSKSAQRAILQGKEFAMMDKRDQIVKEISSAWTSYQESMKQIDIAKENCELAEKNLDLNTFSYNEGKLTILDVLSAQLTWIQAKTNLIQTQYKNKVSIADYKKSIGENSKDEI